MKVGIMIDELVSGSSPKTVGQAVKGLASLGYKSEAIIFKKGSDQAYNFHLSEVPTICLSDRFPFFIKRFSMRFPGFSFFSVNHITNSFFAPFVTKEREWDVIIAHISYNCLTARSLLRWRKIPYFAFIGTEPAYYLLPRIYSHTFLGHIMPILLPLARSFDKYVVENSLAIITFSKFYHHLIKPLTDKVIEVAYPGCFPVDEPNEVREDFVLTYDRWDIGNTPHTFLDILPQLSRKVDLVVAGYWYPESIKTSFLEEVAKRKLSDRVRVLGPLDEKAIIELCSRALVHVHPNQEAFGMQSLEAAACGCPIVVPDGSGVTELFTHGVHGLFPRDRDLGSFIENIDKIVTDPKSAREMGREAWKVAKKNTWKEHTLKLDEIIKKYCGE